MKDKFTKLITVVVIFLVMLALVSCKQKNVKTIMVHNQFALSLFRDTIYMDELLNRTDSTTVNWLRVNEDGSLSAFYHDTINGIVNARDFMTDIADTYFSQSDSFELEETAPVAVPGMVQDSASYTVSIPFAYDDYSIESVTLSRGEMSMTVSVTPALPLVTKVVLTSNAITMVTGEKLTMEFNPSDNDGMSKEVDLTGCTINVNAGQEIPFDGTLYIEYDGQVGFSGGNYECNINGSINNLSFKQLTGTLNLAPYQFAERTPIDFGMEGLTGEIYLPTPMLDLAYRNTFGFDAAADINELSFYSSIQNDSVNMLDSENGVHVEITETQEFVDQPITGYDTQINALGQYTELRFGGLLSMNTGTPVTVTDESEIDLAIGVDLPLQFNIADLKYTDTIAFSATGENNFENYLDEIDFFLDFYNKLPLTVTLEVELLKEGEHTLWLFNDDGTHGNTIITGDESTLECDVRDEDLQMVLDSDQIVISITLSTNGMQSLKIDDFIKVGIRMLTKTENVDIDDIL